MKNTIISVSCLILFTATMLAQSPPSQIELNGFLLGQYQEAADGAFGKPTQVENTEDGGFFRAYVFDSAHNGYMAFRYVGSNKERAYSIQISGDPGTSMRPFLGVKLGDSSSKLISVFGKPGFIKHEQDYPVDLYDYDDRNYSFEINRQDQLSSIEIKGFEGFAKEPSGGETVPDIEHLRKLVMAKDVDGLMTILSSALEIHRNNKMFSFKNAMRTELSDGTLEITRLILADKDSVRAAFMTEAFEPDAQIRLSEKSGPQSVFKFEHSKILREIVYKFEYGMWKVWEIELR